jgi:hypothetical protein
MEMKWSGYRGNSLIPIQKAENNSNCRDFYKIIPFQNDGFTFGGLIAKTEIQLVS